MNLLEKARSKKHIKKEVEMRHIQVVMPAQVHSEVADILAQRGLSWQTVLMSAIEQILEESKKK